MVGVSHLLFIIASDWGSGFSLVDGFSHFDHSRDPVLLYRDTCDRDTCDIGDMVILLVWVAPLECHSGVGFTPGRVPVHLSGIIQNAIAGLEI